MNRRPPPAVRRQLREEVGFGCPMPDCGIPYLTWHHFDPEWRVKEHHRPEGMIALCLTHAGHADANAYEKDHLRNLKQVSNAERTEVQGKLAWMRRRLLALIGGNWYYETPVALKVGTTNAIWFSRDAAGYLLLNLNMPTLSGESRAEIVENYFTVGRDHVADVECSARGRVIKIVYPNGDKFELQYRDIQDEEDLRFRYGTLVGDGKLSSHIEFPLTVVEISEKTANSHLEFDAKSTKLGGNTMIGCWSIANPVGVHFDVSPLEEKLFFPTKSAQP